jgi:hypothetical protein
MCDIASEAKNLVVTAVFCELFSPAVAARESVRALTIDVRIKQKDSRG